MLSPSDRIRGLPPPPDTIAPSPPPHKQPPLPPPRTTPPSDNIPPPPSHPPPTAQELAARSSQQAEARGETAPADPNDPPPEEQEWVAEEAEEEEALEEDEEVEVEVEAEAEPEFPDFVTTERGREVSTRRRRPKRDRSDPPLPVNLVPRETRERIELNREIYRARSITGVSRRPLALRPQVHGYPEIRIDSAGTWARVADPPIATLRRLCHSLFLKARPNIQSLGSTHTSFPTRCGETRHLDHIGQSLVQVI